MSSIQINIGDHTSSEADYIAVPPRLLGQVQWARTKAKWITKNIASADVYYRTLPGGRSLTDLLADSSIWINYHATSIEMALTNFAGGKEIAICNPSFRIGRWTVLASLVHELAHVNGVRGRVDPKGAERAVLECGLGKRSELRTGVDDPFTPYDPTING
jgi:hypothetical protein